MTRHRNRKLNIDDQFLFRVVRNDISASERELFDKWYTTSQKNRDEFAAMIRIWDQTGPSRTVAEPDARKHWENISVKLGLKDRTVTIDSAKNRVNEADQINTGRYRSLKQFAYNHAVVLTGVVVLMLLAAGVATVHQLSESGREGTSSVKSESAMIEMETKNGERKSVILSDGSKIHLNSSSKLTFPSDFNLTERKVELEGEAYLFVAPNSLKPFYVKSGNTVTIVRGTEFNIRNRGASVNVVVAKGIVETYALASTKGETLSKGEYVSYDSLNGLSEPKKADLRHSLAWRNDKFSFSRTSLKEVMDEIERYYNVKVVFKEEALKEKTITGYFNSESMNTILTIISVTLDIKITYSNGIVTIEAQTKRNKSI
jgi:ferric-dicitrate binding protein FerR (iron transport regulator)